MAEDRLAIETCELTRRFQSRIVVDRLELRVAQGDVYGFLGPNGAGKTTTIRMLLGLIRPDEGKVRVFDEPFQSRLLGRIGSLVETPSLYPHLTGRENLEVTRRLLGTSRTAIERVLEIVRMARDGARLVREYSLGMRQRLGLAVALLHSPQLLILDEPTNGLDPAGIHEMRDLLRRMPAEHGVTVFLSSHLLSEVEQIAGSVGILQQGRMKFQGTLRDLHDRQQTQIRVGVRGGRSLEAVSKLQACGRSATSTDADWLVVEDSGEAAAAINGLLWREGFEVFHLAAERRSLEDVFLTLTGDSQ
ncbi:MAG: ABC transporter ATP-binding protein [Acidobacteria bacterium]|nr:ABC transporter ATP-binding protein [Acidobacteriota bacterium]